MALLELGCFAVAVSGVAVTVSKVANPKVATADKAKQCLTVATVFWKFTAVQPQCFRVSRCYRLLERQKLDNGNKWPETIAVVLWGTDNIKTYGESLAQVSSHTVAVLIVKCVSFLSELE